MGSPPLPAEAIARSKGSNAGVSANMLRLRPSMHGTAAQADSARTAAARAAGACSCGATADGNADGGSG
eukprot:scaffold95399_cov31-Tisochrysis_lutea.AAC.3